MPRTPKRADRSAKPGSRFTSEVVADHVHAFRVLRRMSQDDLASAMRDLGHDTWSRQTVSEIERYGRTVNVDELVSLAVVLRVPPNRMLDPFALEQGGDWLSEIDFGGPTTVPSGLVEYWVSGQLTIGLDPGGGFQADAHTPKAEEALRSAIKAQKATIRWARRRERARKQS